MLDFFIPVAVMLSAGLLGGYGGYLLGPPDPAELPGDKRNWYLKRSLVLGVVAAFIVPIFLRLFAVATSLEAKGSFLVTTDPDTSTWLLFFGFCLIASVSSQRFISKVTDALLAEAIENSRIAKADTDALKEKVEEVEQGVLASTIKPITDTSKVVLQAMYSHDKKRPNFTEIVEATSLEEKDVEDSIEELLIQGLIDPKKVQDVDTWRIRTAGKAILGMLHIQR